MKEMFQSLPVMARLYVAPRTPDVDVLLHDRAAKVYDADVDAVKHQVLQL
jgi:hypothetical protein